jgi:hypothetical protein
MNTRGKMEVQLRLFLNSEVAGGVCMYFSTWLYKLVEYALKIERKIKTILIFSYSVTQIALQLYVL